MCDKFNQFREGISVNVSDTEAALLYLREHFSKGEVRFPPLHFLHQIYALLKNKTKVDKEANDLQVAGKIIFYKLGGDKDNIAEIVIFTEDIKQHVSGCTESKVALNFVEGILPLIGNVFVDNECLMNKFSLTQANIRELVQEGLLVIRDIGSYWLSFPRAGEFVKAYNLGRKEILRVIKKSKYSEILESELKKRRLGKKATLGMAYHISDVIGSEAVKCIYTTSGALLRYDS